MALSDFTISFTTSPIVEFNDSPKTMSPASTIFADIVSLNKIGQATTLFADLAAFNKIGQATTLFADLAAFNKIGPAGTLDTIELCSLRNILGGSLRSILSGPLSSTLSCG